MKQSTNRTAFITGASSGIGKACALLFAKHGYRLILSARRTARLVELENELKQLYGGHYLSFNLDVRNIKEIDHSVKNLDANWQDIDVLINNAGLALGLQKFQDANMDDWEQMIDTNVKGLLYMTKAILPNMIKRKSGHIINIGSIAGHECYPCGNVYSATKYAVNAISKSLRIDLLGLNIRVTSVDPGMANTEFSVVRFKGDQPRADNVYKGFSALSADDIADAVFYCASRPAHVNIEEMIIMPTDQASTTHLHKNL